MNLIQLLPAPLNLSYKCGCNSDSQLPELCMHPSNALYAQKTVISSTSAQFPHISGNEESELEGWTEQTDRGISRVTGEGASHEGLCCAACTREGVSHGWCTA